MVTRRVQYGPAFRAVAVYLVCYQLLPYKRACELLNELYATALSPGTLAALTQAQAYKTRYHGDYHLGQVLKTGQDFVILDFEGEPARSLAERRAKHSPLKDVAGMMRSFNYAAYAGLFEAQEKDNPEKQELEEWAAQWETLVVKNFQDGYCEATGQNEGARFIPESNEVMQKALDVFLLEKAFYELNYEFNNRPTWVPIPLKGILRIIGQG